MFNYLRTETFILKMLLSNYENLLFYMHQQAVHIQTLIQENSRLNIKLFPDNSDKISLGGRYGKKMS